MDEEMPTTEHVRAQYARQENYDEFYEGDLYLTPDGQVSAREFDAWLADHDRAVAANAWDECDRRHLEYEHSVRSAPPSNPYRITEENN